MSNYTKGPWVALPEECDKPYIRIRGTALGGRYKLANVLTPVYEGVHEREAKETRSNARLIAAAPELLEALKRLLNAEHDEHLTPQGLRNLAKEVIAKAEGPL